MISVLDLGFGPEELASVKQQAAPTVIPQGNTRRRAGWKVESYKCWACLLDLSFFHIVQLLVLFDSQKPTDTTLMCGEEKQQI